MCPALTVATGISFRCPIRFCPRASTNSKSPSVREKTATSASAFSRKLPSPLGKPNVLAGLVAARSITCSKLNPRCKNLDSVVARSNTGPFTLKWCTSLEIVPGMTSCFKAFSAVSKEKLPAPCPTSRWTPRLTADLTSGKTRPFPSKMPPSPPRKL